jgi:AmiR/NasT family two-component response regulator
MADIIEEAQQVLSRRFRISSPDAYALLLRLAKRARRSLVLTAGQLVDDDRRPYL